MEKMILPVGHDRIQDGCQIDPHGTLFRHFNIYNFLLDNICFQKKLVSLNIPGGAREAPLSTRLIKLVTHLKLLLPKHRNFCKPCNLSP